VIGTELESVLPEAVEVVPSRTFPNPQRGQPPVTVTDLAVVDKNVLFMYGLGALQELMARQVRNFLMTTGMEGDHPRQSRGTSGNGPGSMGWRTSWRSWRV
jgi:hypothetical protein